MPTIDMLFPVLELYKLESASRKSEKNINSQFQCSATRSSPHLRLFQIVAVFILHAMSRSRRHAIVGATRMEKSVPTAVLSNVQEIRSSSVSLPLGPAALGCPLFGDRQ